MMQLADSLGGYLLESNPLLRYLWSYVIFDNIKLLPEDLKSWDHSQNRMT